MLEARDRVGGGHLGLWTAVDAKRRNPGQRVVLLEGRLDRADHRQGKRDSFLRALDAAGLGFGS